jgi:hypothetical protein
MVAHAGVLDSWELSDISLKETPGTRSYQSEMLYIIAKPGELYFKDTNSQHISRNLHIPVLWFPRYNSQYSQFYHLRGNMR